MSDLLEIEASTTPNPHDQIGHKMKPEIKALWLAALRDPERKQVVGGLRSDEGECCLGVLCDVAVKNGVIPDPWLDEDGSSAYRAGFYKFADNTWSADYNSSTLPMVVSEWAGLRSENPNVFIDKAEGRIRGDRTLSELNDDWGYDFDMIADIIDEQL